jgi:hypothetical protein
MNEIELAWAAGLFEGEGTVRIKKYDLDGVVASVQVVRPC